MSCPRWKRSGAAVDATCPAIGQLVRRESWSGQDIRHHAVGQRCNLVFEHQLAFFQPRLLELVAIARQSRQLDFKVEAAVLAFQHGHKLGRIIVVHRPALQEARPAVTGAASNGQSQRTPAEAMSNGEDFPRISWFSHRSVTRQPTKGN